MFVASERAGLAARHFPGRMASNLSATSGLHNICGITGLFGDTDLIIHAAGAGCDALTTAASVQGSQRAVPGVWPASRLQASMAAKRYGAASTHAPHTMMQNIWFPGSSKTQGPESFPGWASSAGLQDLSAELSTCSRH